MKTNIYKKLGYAALSLSFTAAISAVSFSTQAQLANCNAFIQGNYVEVGVNFNGAYGSSAAAPSGYHPHVPNQPGIYNASTCTKTLADSNLGFVADPAKDGWGIAGAGMPAYMGDYFVPGSPFEGWSIKADGDTQANNWNGGPTLAPKTAAGANVRYFVSGSKRATEWEGTFDSLHIVQRTIMDTANTYFVIRVKIKNLATRKRKDVYYFRSVDPDNDQTWPLGGFPTDNTITYQNPHPSNLCVVSSWGKGYDTSVTYLGMGTKDPRAVCFLNKNWPSSVPIDLIHSKTLALSGSYSFDSLTSITSDLAIGLVFKIDSLPAYDSTILRMAYMFGGPEDISGATDDEGLLPEEMPTGIYEPDASNVSIKTAPNPFHETLTLSGVEEKDRIRLFNIQGSEIKASWTANNKERILNATDLPVGIYILSVENEGGQIKFKQVLQHN